MQSVIKHFVIILVKLYQNTLGVIFPPSCRYSPSCSQYMIDAVKKYGTGKGSILGTKRILRCHPYSKHNTWDPVK